MGLIDTHTHLESFVRRGELPAVLQRAAAAGIEAMIAIGTDVDDWVLYRDLASRHVGVVHYAVGLHPGSVDEGWARRLAQLEGFWQAELHPVALGEIGLDRYHLPKDDPAAAGRIIRWQRAAFTEGLTLARRLDCPVVVHSREAFSECVDMIDASGVDWRKVVFHCFSGGPAEMAELNRRGGRGSITGIITYKNAEAIRAAARAQGLEKLLLETDAPYLSPLPHRGKPNEPAFVRHTAEFCAGLLGVDYERLADATTRNARAFFGL
jgi:TatD DNase family protein